MDSQVTDLENRQWRIGGNDYRHVTVKGAGPETFETASLLQYDPTDDTFVAYTGALAADRVAGIINLDEDFILTPASGPFSMCNKGDVWADKLTLPGAFGIDDRPNGAALSIREQLRDVGIYAKDRDAALNENNVNP